MKNKKAKNAIIIVVVILILFFVVRYVRARNDQAGEKSLPGPSSGSGSSSGSPKATPTVIDNNTTLKKGMAKNDRVMWVQSHFNKYVAPARGYAKIAYDGVFGSKTEDAVFKTLGKKTTTWNEFKAHVESNYTN